MEVIEEGRDNVLWIGTKSGGLNCYDILKDSITKMSTISTVLFANFNYQPAEIKIKEFIANKK
ncbi:hypothetical protein [Pedobacter arcticus]|uniref:hypothetical protein n=1 Tax=Pedobacter arcticus TaxID=752140 RepID=UPI000302DB52|nr:hypothetical protein [Pedobacter arcticus]